MYNHIRQRFNYCPICGGSLAFRLRKNRPRLTCAACSYIFYENPIVGVAGILLDGQGNILLGRRNSGKYQGLWCIPCGYLEYDEDLYQGVQREFKEETNLVIAVKNIFTAQSNFHDPLKHSVGIWFMVEALGGSAQAGDDLDQLDFFRLDNPPPMAFSNDQLVLGLLKNSIR